MKKPAVVILAIVVCVICVVTFVCSLVFLLQPKDKNTSESNKVSPSNKSAYEASGGASYTYDCLFTANDAPAKIDTYAFELALTTDEEVEWGEVWKDSGNRRIELSALQNYKAKEKVYFSYYKLDGSYIDDYDLSMQVCDGNNKTNFSNYIEDKNINNIISDSGDGQSINSYTELPGFSAPENKGNYRLDAMVFYNNQWRLVARFNEIIFY